MNLSQHPSQPARGWVRCAIPEARRQGGLRGRRVGEDAPGQQGQFGQALPTLGGEHELPRSPQHLLCPEGEPLDRPAVPIHRLHLPPGKGQRRVQQQGFSKVWVMHDNRGKGGGAWWGVGQYQVVPELCGDDAGASGVPPCQVSRRSGGVAAIVRPL
jgi:hypothetical protein